MTSSEIDYETSLKLENPLYVDVRTEKEYNHSHIIGSVNIPVFTDEERAIVGTIYDQGLILKAKSLGVTYGAAKLPEIFEFIAASQKKQPVVLYCSRGGYRSGSLYHFFQGIGIFVFKLKSGYKGYRNYIINSTDALSNKLSFVNLTGYTGSGKTKIIEKLKTHGCQTLNLEELANHRGSLLGAVGLSQQPSQKMFESLIEYELRKFDSKRPVFIEDESSKIGSLYVPAALYKAYAHSDSKVFVAADMDLRIKNILTEYLAGDKAENLAELESAIDEIQRYIGKAPAEKLKAALKNEQYIQAAKYLMENYYDKNYSIKSDDIKMKLENSDPEKSAKAIIKLFGK